MKLKLFIHIGQPKTGSSAIQAFLNYNRENLVKKHHLLYPDFSGIDLGKGLLHNHEKVFTNAKLNNDYNGCIETFNKCKTYCEHNKITQVVLSNESFGWYWWPELLKQIIATLDCDFKIILYLRRQDHWIESAWKQWGHKCNEYSTIQDFSEKFNMDWNLPLKQWLTFFNPDDFIVRPFEKNVIGNDVVKDFLKIINIEDNTEFIEPTSNNLNKNAGFNREIIEILKLCQKQSNDVNDNILLDFLSTILPEPYKKQDPFHPYGLLSPSERLEIVNKYEPSNNEIGKIFFGLQREKLFTEPMPDADEPWKPFEGLTVEKVVPIFIDMLLNMQKQIQLIENSNSIRKNNNAEPIIQENDYDFTDIHLRNLLDKIKFNKQIVEINISDSGLSFMSAGTDPYFFLPKSLFVKNMRAIRIEISAPENTTFQLFHKTGAFKPYIESNSVRRHLQAGRNTVILSLPVQGFKGKLRIDPGCHVGKYIIHKFEISF